MDEIPDIKEVKDTITKWGTFQLEAYAIYKGLLNAQKELIHRDIISKPKLPITEEFLPDLEKMLKLIYNKNLKGFVARSRSITLDDALSAITDKLYLSKELSRKSDSRRTYTLPEYSYYKWVDGKKHYLTPSEAFISGEEIDLPEDTNLYFKDNPYSYINLIDNLCVEKTRLSKPQLIIMGYKKELTDDSIKNQKAMFNYLATVTENAIIDYIKKEIAKSNQENLVDIDDEDMADRYLIGEDNSQEALQDIQIRTDIQKLSEQAFELSKQGEQIYRREIIELVLNLSMYSFQSTEISKILETPHHKILEIRDYLKEALFTMAVDSNLQLITDLEGIDSYLQGLTDNMQEYRQGLKKSGQVEALSLVDIQKQLKQVLGRDYYKIQEIRELLDRT